MLAYILIAAFAVKAVLPTPILIRQGDWITIMQVESVFRRHRVAYQQDEMQDFGNLRFEAYCQPKVISNLLGADAPEQSFSLCIKGLRQFSEKNNSRWQKLEISKHRTLTGKEKIFRMALASVSIMLPSIQKLRYLTRPYIGTDDRHHSGYEIEVDVYGHAKRFELFELKGHRYIAEKGNSFAKLHLLMDGH